MTIGEKYNITNEDIKRSWGNTRVKEYVRQQLLYGKADFELETDIEKAVYYCRFLIKRK